MRRSILLLGLLACMLSGSNCSLFKIFSRKHKPEENKAGEMFVGVVESVNPEQKFVLVRTNVRVVLPTGSKLESRSPNGSKASLMLTPERKTNLLAADIVDGFPSAGDVVVLPVQTPPAVQAPSAAPSVR
jgi:hypothetical protein